MMFSCRIEGQSEETFQADADGNPSTSTTLNLRELDRPDKIHGEREEQNVIYLMCTTSHHRSIVRTVRRWHAVSSGCPAANARESTPNSGNGSFRQIVMRLMSHYRQLSINLLLSESLKA